MGLSLDIKKEAAAFGISIESLELERNRILKEECMQKYIKNKEVRFLWEELKDASALSSDSNGWRLILDFIQDKSCLMFFEDHDDEDMLVIKNGKDLFTLVAEMYGFEFYVTDFETSYLLCFNHHDVLSGCGTAKPWIDSLKQLSDEEYRNLIRNLTVERDLILPIFEEEPSNTGSSKGISLEIKKVAEIHGILVKSLKAECMKAVKAECMRMYIENKEINFLWEGMKKPSTLVSPIGGKLIFDFLQDGNCLMFFDDHDDMLFIKNGRDFFTIVNEMPSFEFYITDLDASFLLCFNRHDCLLGCGSAKSWVDYMRYLEIGQDFVE